MSGGITAAVIGGTALVGGAYMSSQAAKSAANTQAGAADRATQAQREIMERQVELNKPFYDVGVTAVNRLSEQRPFELSKFDFKADPGYAFTLEQGLKGMNATAAARGGLISGNALAAGQRYGQNLGSTYYQQAFNNYLAQNQANLGAYTTNRSGDQYLANLGQSSANTTANQLGAFGNAQASNIMGAANAQAAGQIGSANAYTNAIGQGVGAYQMNQLINRSAYSGGNTRVGGAAPITDYSELYTG